MNSNSILSSLIGANGRRKIASEKIKYARQLSKAKDYMLRQGMGWLLRADYSFGGVILGVNNVVEQSTHEKKRMATVLYPDGDIDEECLDEWDDDIRSFEDITHVFGDIFMMTGRTSPAYNAEILRWLHPADAEPVQNLRQKLRSMEIALTEYKNNAQEANHKAEMEMRKAMGAEEQLVAMKRQLREMSQKYTSLSSEYERIKARQQETHIIYNAIKEQVDQMSMTLVKMGREKGEDKETLVKDFIGYIEEIVGLTGRALQQTEEDTSDRLSVIETEAEETKETIKKLAEQQKKEGEGGKPPEKTAPQGSQQQGQGQGR